MTLRIPFNRPAVVGEERAYLDEALRSGHLSGDGAFTKRCEALLERAIGAPKVLLTTSCTDALEMSALLLDIGPGDEVVVPSFTFTSTANAYAVRGGRPVFCDIRPDTLNLDETLLESLITARTKAVVVVHYAGVACEMVAIREIAERRGVAVIEDNAHGLCGTFRGAPLGSFGCLATQSFHETKNFSSGEGGALVINDTRFVERAEILREKGTDRSRFFRGEVDKYGWVDLGSSFLPSELVAAVLCAQLEQRDRIQARRSSAWRFYAESLSEWAAEHGVGLPQVPPHCEHPAHLFYVLLPSHEAQRGFIAHMKSRSILAVFHYVPLHLSKMGRSFGGRDGDCAVTEDVSARLVRLPLYNDISDGDLAEVVEAVRSFSP